ncbi:beta strand repeat-containing protein [Anatilimnocola sp. NA78]|uniref:beta strand repeat-containing protein n=1 Tax=Anatilimnocola sp. NA78 TaxID=3415683 RepID=UPI003CE45DAB
MFSFLTSASKTRSSKLSKAPKKQTKQSLFFETLEGREVMSGFSVLNLNDSGAGSLRQAITSANSNPGADVISFNVAGTISLSSALPTITGEVEIDGTSAPGFAGAPVVEIDHRNFGGLTLLSGASGSEIRSLSLVKSRGNGITLRGVSNTLIVGNYVGLDLNGTTAEPNAGQGIELISSLNNIIGGDTALERNVISANKGNGLRLDASSSNQILGNYIGTDATGTLDRGNTFNGVWITNSSASNVVEGNVISGNNVNGVLISAKAKLNTVADNYIGTTAAGTAALGNTKEGVRIESATENLIGHADPVSSITYNDTDDISLPVSAWQGLRAADNPGDFLIVGTSGSDGLLYEGTIDGSVGTSYAVNYPSAADTSVYGPDNLGSGNLRMVGSYRNADYATAPVTVNGFLFEGTTGDLATAGNYQTVNYPGAKFNYVHSTSGGLAVGNYDSVADHGANSLPLGPGHAYIYDIDGDDFLTDVVYPGSLSNTAYGIWHNGEGKYTIVGGYSLTPVNNLEDQDRPIGSAYMVDYDATTGNFSNWASFAYPEGTNYITHFEGISSVEKGIYTLNADSVQSGSSDPTQGSFVTVHRQPDGSFGPATWVDLNYPVMDPEDNISSSNAVYGNQVVGLVIGTEGPIPYQATINVEFQLSNVISGNGDNGIGLYGAHDNEIAMNYIGTDLTGTIDLGNAKNGIMLTSSSARNVIGGVATGGNDPTNDVFVRPPQGNLISGNNANGVLITGKATQNQLSGNFVGTTASGVVALGNALDGVAIVGANGNSLIGCTLLEDPFVFYNVISGNGANGLRVTDSNDTTIQANFFGMGSDNDTGVANALNGVVVEGTSTRTTMGGPIPLGNVVAANTQNGIVVRGKASYFVSYNTFAGIAAFSTNTTLGNGLDGMLITSTGGNILIRTNVISSNGDDGIEVSGAATGVRITENIIGLNTNGSSVMGNGDNGVEVGGTAHHLVVGGPGITGSIIPQNIIGGNDGNGVAIIGKAHHITVSNGYIGTDVFGEVALGNGEAGVYVGTGTYSNTIGSDDPDVPTLISGNDGNGIELRGTKGNIVLGTLIGTNPAGVTDLGNGGNGILINTSTDNVIGRIPSPVSPTSGSFANLIVNNEDNGVLVESGSRNAIFGNSIHSNDLLGIDLATGANINQAAPVLSTAVKKPLGTQISGILTSKPRTTYIIEFFASDVNAPSGKISLGTKSVTTNASGVASYTFFGPLPPATANFFTATATDPTRNTSEFSSAITL